MRPGDYPIEITAGKLGGKGDTKHDRYSTGVSYHDLVSDLGKFLGRRVVERGPRTSRAAGSICWIIGQWDRKELSPEERALTLKNLADQTGLTVAEAASGSSVEPQRSDSPGRDCG